MALNSRFNDCVCLITLDGGSGGYPNKKNTYGSYVSGGVPAPTPAPSPVTPPPYGNNGASTAPSTLTSVGNDVGTPTPSYGANAGKILSGGANAGVTFGSGTGSNAGAGVNTGIGSGTGSGAGSDPNAGSTGTGSGVMSYESYLAFIESQRRSGLTTAAGERDASYAAAAKYREESERLAEIERQRGVVDARSSYEQNKATYGANAEAMGRMGLTGSGYSDYLNSRAYAVQRAETQEANANAETAKREARYAEEQSRLQADKTYYDRKLQIDTTYQTNMLAAEKAKADEEKAAVEKEQSDYETLLGFAMNGTLTKDQLTQLAKDKNLSEDHTTSVLAAADDYILKTENDKKDAEKSQNYNNWMKLIEVGGISDSQKADIAAAAANGDISVSEMNMLRSVYSSSYDFSFANDTRTGYMAYDKAVTELQKLRSDPLATTELINRAQESFDSIYKNAAKEAGVKYEEQLGNQRDFSAGDDFDVVVGTEDYKVTSAGFVTDQRVIENAKRLKGGTVFVLDGMLYMKTPGGTQVIRLKVGAARYNDVLECFEQG